MKNKEQIEKKLKSLVKKLDDLEERTINDDLKDMGHQELYHIIKTLEWVLCE